MIFVKKITNPSIWETFLKKNHTGSFPFFQTWAWGDVQQRMGFSVQRVGLFEEKELVGIAQVIEVKAKRGHYFYLRHAPVLKKFQEKYISNLIEYLKHQATTQHISFIRMSRFPLLDAPKSNANLHSYFSSSGFVKSPLQTIDTQLCWVLDLTPSEDELLRNMRKSHRYLIKKSLQSDITLIKTTELKDIEKFMPLYADLAKRKHFIPHKEVIDEFEIFGKEKNEVLYMVIYQGKVIAGALIAFVGDTAVYRHSALDETYRQLPASYLIQWEAIKEAKQRGMQYYNFWGISDPSDKKHPWYGHTLFKTGFGGFAEYYLPTIDLPLHMLYWKNWLVDWVSFIKKRA